jgi:hypothetical protein
MTSSSRSTRTVPSVSSACNSSSADGVARSVGKSSGRRTWNGLERELDLTALKSGHDESGRKHLAPDRRDGLADVRVNLH